MSVARSVSNDIKTYFVRSSFSHDALLEVPRGLRVSANLAKQPQVAAYMPSQDAFEVFNGDVMDFDALTNFVMTKLSQRASMSA
eukprot:CAMPEP_0178467184 /NCGR_PEP_ID=MMETSP0689_2-20121128/52284_1 /TAXON_ID=160604 /ORGANISM="Amphidinium massartii, Strain CS-259" /LENGTH=83 /DNA_ID=CAMNT_0020094223 /DNA_START=127 /DNA_END=378 /DNA_ORIENTATION=+